jgi:hypothetical protein
MSAFRLKRSSDVLNPGGVSSNGLGKEHWNGNTNRDCAIV